MSRPFENDESAALPIRRFVADRSGSIVVKFALMLPLLLTVIGGAVDRARLLRHEEILQSAVDAAALAAAKEITITNVGQESLGSVAKQAVLARLEARQRMRDMGVPTVETVVRDDPLEVDVLATSTFESAFGETFGFGTLKVQARAIARVVGKPNICVLALDESDNGTLSLEHQARVTGQDCAVFSNSKHNVGIKTKNDAQLTASVICSAGGVQGGGKNFVPAPLKNCPVFDDPLSGRVEPMTDPCDPNRPKVITTSTDLWPGTYCGLTIENGATVRLKPQGNGVFVFKDAPLIVRDGGSLIGEAAGLYFTGTNANFTFEADSTIDLEAPRSGPMAGLLVFSARAMETWNRFQILSNNARKLVGTIYIPRGELRVDATSPIADQSAYTAVVAQKIRLYGGPHLVLNTNYDDTDVPVPDGIRGTGQPIALAR